MKPIRSLPLHRLRPSPHNSWVGSCIIRFVACSAFTRVTTCRLAKSPYATLYTGGSGSFVASAAAPIATGWSDPVPGRVYLPLWSSAFHGALLMPGFVNQGRMPLAKEAHGEHLEMVCPITDFLLLSFKSTGRRRVSCTNGRFTLSERNPDRHESTLRPGTDCRSTAAGR